MPSVGLELSDPSPSVPRPGERVDLSNGSIFEIAEDELDEEEGICEHDDLQTEKVEN